MGLICRLEHYNIWYKVKLYLEYRALYHFSVLNRSDIDGSEEKIIVVTSYHVNITKLEKIIMYS
jgi:hypothetical protein